MMGPLESEYLPGRSHWDIVIPSPTQGELDHCQELNVARELYGVAWCCLTPHPRIAYAVLLLNWGDHEAHPELRPLQTRKRTRLRQGRRRRNGIQGKD